LIGTQETGTLPGIVVSAVTHEGLSVTVNGQPARLAVVLAVVADGLERIKRAVRVRRERPGVDQRPRGL
jgi:hypothetical protein